MNDKPTVTMTMIPKYPNETAEDYRRRSANMRSGLAAHIASIRPPDIRTLDVLPAAVRVAL